jgi:DNA-binding NarL/FixJ family response regulator
MRVVLIAPLTQRVATMRHALEAAGAVVLWQTELPADDRAWNQVATADVALVAVGREVGAELSFVELVRERCPLVEVVCSTAAVALAEALETLRRGVYAVVPDSASSADLTGTIVDACRRGARARGRLDALEHGSPRGPKDGR